MRIDMLPPALFVLTVASLACIRQDSAVQLPPVPGAARLPLVAQDANLTAAVSLVTKAIENLPSWEKDGLARYEQPQLSAVRHDVDACVSATTDDDFLIDVEQLKTDAGSLEALDSALAKEQLI